MDHDPSQATSLGDEAVARFESIIQAGGTVSLSAAQLADPKLREQLPEILEQLRLRHPQAPRLQVRGYTVLGEIAQGGMSVVYLARHDQLGRNVALKVVPSVFEGQDRSRERTLREARAMASVAHPNIVTVHDIIDTGDVLALAMEWVDGLTLAQIVRELNPLASPGDLDHIARVLGTAQPLNRPARHTAAHWFARVLRDIALAVEHVHQAGLLHLDIKPSNILVRRDGTALLADFGVVREIDMFLSRSRSFAGTPIYAAPEQFQRRGATLSAPTDVYGLGITLYEALARAKPLEEGSLSRILSDLESGRIPRLSSRCEVPSDLENIVHKAIHPDSTRRYQTAAAFAADLTEFLEHRPVSARASLRGDNLRRWAKARPWRAVVTALVLVTLPTAGLVIAAEWPHFQARRAEATHRDAMTVAHAAVQSTASTFDALNAPLFQLKRRVAELPDDPMLAAIYAVLAGTRDLRFTEAALDANVETKNHLGLQLLRRRMIERRETFSSDEFRTLADSTDPLDLTIVALEEARCGEQANASYALEIVQKALRLSPRSDPLLMGLQCHFARITRNKSLVADCVTAIERLWPDDPAIRSWTRHAAGDLPRQLEIQRELSKAFPDESAVRQSLIMLLLLCGLEEEAVTAAMDAGMAEPDLPVNLLQAHLVKRRGDSAKATMAAEKVAAHPDLPVEQKALIVSIIAPELSKPLVDQSLRAALPDVVRLARIAENWQVAGLEPFDRKLVEAAVRRFVNADPRVSELIHSLPKMCAAFPKLAAEQIAAAPSLHNLDERTLHLAFDCLRDARHWQGALRLATGARESSQEKRVLVKAAFYEGMALARLGRTDEGFRSIAHHLKTGGSKVYLEAYVEQARYLSGPNTPNEHRDPTQALHLCDQIDRNLLKRQSQRPPWFTFVRSQAEFANGNATAALALAQEARESLDAASQSGRTWQGAWAAPDDFSQELDDALLRYRTALGDAGVNPEATATPSDPAEAKGR